MNGIVNLDKPAGPSSAGVLNQLKRLLPLGIKIGHAGTLDPFATGVLLVLVGKATRLSQSLMDEPKRYEATVQFGGTTATDDSESAERVRANLGEPPGLGQIQVAVAGMTGTVLQRPPDYSAMKIGGRRAYRLARAGQAVELAPRAVRIDSIEIVEYAWPRLRLAIACGRGTYIRAIARDLGETLAVGGYLSQLRRTQVGRYAADDAIGLPRIITEGIETHLQGVA